MKISLEFDTLDELRAFSAIMTKADLHDAEIAAPTVHCSVPDDVPKPLSAGVREVVSKAATALSTSATLSVGEVVEAAKAGTLVAKTDAMMADMAKTAFGSTPEPVVTHVALVEPDTLINSATVVTGAPTGDRGYPTDWVIPSSLDAFGERDGEQTPFHDAIHTGKTNGDGTWRQRRKLDKSATILFVADLREAYARLSKAETTAGADSEPVASETHALPADEETSDAAAAPTLDYADLVESAQVLAGDISQDSTIHMLSAAKGFIKTYGTEQFDLLKAAVAGDKTVQHYEPGERRLLIAAIQLAETGGAA